MYMVYTLILYAPPHFTVSLYCLIIEKNSHMSTRPGEGHHR